MALKPLVMSQESSGFCVIYVKLSVDQRKRDQRKDTLEMELLWSILRDVTFPRHLRAIIYV